MLTTPAAFFSPGPMEMLIIGLVCAVPLVAGIVIVAVLSGLSSRKNTTPPPCPRCGGWTVPGTRFCPHCGGALMVPEQAAKPEAAAESEPGDQEPDER